MIRASRAPAGARILRGRNYARTCGCRVGRDGPAVTPRCVIGVSTPGLAWVRAGHSSLVRPSWWHPRRHSPRSDSVVRHLGPGHRFLRGDYMTKRTKTDKKRTAATTATSLPTVQPRVAGSDVGSSQHWVCGPARGDDGKPAIRSFGTTTVDLEALVDWLVAQGTKSAAMESTYVYWIPLYELLESRGIEPVLVNARQLHNVPGRKTDVSDCQWLQLLHSHGLLRGSFRPSEAISRLRALQRQMGNLVAERSRCVQWMQKSLDQMNVQVHRAVTDLTGKTGMAIVRAIVAGERDPARLTVHRDGRCRKSSDEIAKYLTGHWR